MIYCGYQGVGKTSYCNSHENCIDLDSSSYLKKEGWEAKYIEIAIELEKAGKDVFISAHREVVNHLMSLGHDFILIIPNDTKKFGNIV